MLFLIPLPFADLTFHYLPEIKGFAFLLSTLITLGIFCVNYQVKLNAEYWGTVSINHTKA